MTNNAYPIQIKKRTLLNLIGGIIGIFLIYLFFRIMFALKSPVKFEFLGFSASILVILFFVGCGFIILIIQVFYNLLYLKSIEYSLDSKNLTFKGGVISRFEKIIPYQKIQHVIVYETYWQKILGLSSLSIETAREGGYNAGVYRQQGTIQIRTGPIIPDLNKEDAENLKNDILSRLNKYKSVAGI